MLKEWPLVAFTILGQMAVGVFLLFHAPFLSILEMPGGSERAAWLTGLTVVIVLISLAALVSFFHLRRPFRARHVLANLRTSWLSREVLFELAFLGLVALVSLLVRSRSPAYGTISVLLAAAGLTGLLFLFSMARLYMLPTLPAWNDISTPLSFFLTTLNLGAAATTLIVYGGGMQWTFLLDLPSLSSVVILIEVFLAALVAPHHGLAGVRLQPSLRPSGGPPRALHWARITLLSAGLALIAMARWAGFGDVWTVWGPSPGLVLAFVFVLAGEVAGRFHFYGLVGRPGR